MSSFMHSLEVGDRINVKGPFAKLAYTANMKKQVGMIAGGSGITPMLQVLHEILDNPNDETEVTLVYANQGEDDIILKVIVTHQDCAILLTHTLLAWFTGPAGSLGKRTPEFQGALCT